MGSLRAYAACGLVVALALAGCTGGGDDPPVSGSTTSRGSTTSSATTSSTSSTTNSSPTTATVDIPAAARAHTPKGAEAFVKFFLEQAALAWTRPDATLIMPLSDPGCLSCKDLQKTASELVTKGQRYRSSPISIQSVVAVGGFKDQTHVHVQMTQKKVDVIDSQGAVVLTDPYQKLTRTVGLVWKGDSWRLYGIAA